MTLSRCCDGCPHLIREKCEKAYNKYSKEDSPNFIYCNTQNIRLLLDVVEN